MKCKGVGVEDAPFMVLAAVAVIMMVVWIGISVMAAFVEGNERQATIEASMDIYKMAKLTSLGYDASSERLAVWIPKGYAVMIDGYALALGDAEFANGTLMNSTRLTEPLRIQGVQMVAENMIIPPGEHEMRLTYSAKDAEVTIYWE